MCMNREIDFQRGLHPLHVEGDATIFCWVCGVLTSWLGSWYDVAMLERLRDIHACIQQDDWMAVSDGRWESYHHILDVLAGYCLVPILFFNATELMTFNVAMSANRELSCQMMCLCSVVVVEDLHAPKSEGVPSLSKKLAHPLCMLSPWSSAPSKTSLSVGAGWVSLWFLSR